MLSGSGSLHSLPAYSYLAKPFEPPGGQASSRPHFSTQPRPSKDAPCESSSRAETATGPEALPQQEAVKLRSASDTAGAHHSGTLMQPGWLHRLSTENCYPCYIQSTAVIAGRRLCLSGLWSCLCHCLGVCSLLLLRLLEAVCNTCSLLPKHCFVLLHFLLSLLTNMVSYLQRGSS